MSVGQFLRGLSSEESHGELVLWGVSKANLYISLALSLVGFAMPFLFPLLLRLFERDRLQHIRRRLGRLQGTSFPVTGSQFQATSDGEEALDGAEVSGTQEFFRDFRYRLAATRWRKYVNVLFKASGHRPGAPDN